MVDTDSVRIEISFDGGQIMGAIVTAQGADDLERALASGGDGTHTLDASDGRYSIAIRRVVYVKRYARESRVGFGI